MRMTLIPSLRTACPAYAWFSQNYAKNGLFCKAVGQQKARKRACEQLFAAATCTRWIRSPATARRSFRSLASASASRDVHQGEKRQAVLGPPISHARHRHRATFRQNGNRKGGPISSKTPAQRANPDDSGLANRRFLLLAMDDKKSGARSPE
jgi:hypothetical protein